ncbi:hypothetical protein AXF42_Ash016023 [Apostasia shenzhenica]|uniref:Uncharacterized protein n=1 Tax=Apostasia shenzhenica TaxID=1088818 RepID=A0A2I0B374_9ASPA|nr:hypothetical protein AXF42_Ash016023 [Apostasia shenzhenica]
MASKNPIFPMPESQHYSDYGFDPQIDYFLVLEEARRRGRRTEGLRSSDALRFKLQKPISKDDRSKSKKRRQWWKYAFGLFWKRGRAASAGGSVKVSAPMYVSASASPWCSRSRSPSGPLYATECMNAARSSGPLFGDAGALPYVSLRDLTIAEDRRLSTGSSPMPIYLVT